MESLGILYSQLSQKILDVPGINSSASVNRKCDCCKNSEGSKLMRVGKADIVRVPHYMHPDENLQSDGAKHQIERLSSHWGKMLQRVHL
jgi:hypothetical protein